MGDMDPTNAVKQIKIWERACKISKYLQTASDKSALQFVVGKASGLLRTTAWRALFDYAREIEKTKRTVKTFSMQLMRAELARGWNKACFVYKRRKQDQQSNCTCCVSPPLLVHRGVNAANAASFSVNILDQRR